MKVTSKHFIPYLNFYVLDNPYNCVSNVFRYKFTFPVHFYLKSDTKKELYSIFKKEEYRNNKFILSKNIDSLYPVAKDFFYSNAINIQTAKLLKNSLSIFYHDPMIINDKEIRDKVFVPGKKELVGFDEIHSTDIYIPLNFKYDLTEFNRIWKKI